MFVRILTIILFFNDFILIPYCFTILTAVIFTVSSVEGPLFSGGDVYFGDILKRVFPFVILFVLFFVSQRVLAHEQKISTTANLFLILGILVCMQIYRVCNQRSEILEKVESFIDKDIAINGTILSKEGENGYMLRSNRNELGNVLLRIPQYSVIQPGSMCKISGRLVEPSSFESFDYKKYLFRNGTYSIMEVDTYECGNGGNTILLLRSKIENSINSNLPEPESSLLAGIIFGSERVFTREFSESLQKSGLSHIISASGYNVALLASFVDKVFKKGNIKVVCLTKISVIWIFALFAGLSSSIVRASTMSTIYFFAILLGRDISKGVLIIFCITVLVVINPFVIYDIGFLLSSSATIGLIFFPKCFDVKSKWIKENFLPTFTCTLFTLPVVIYYFKKLSIISILSNIVIAPIIQSTIYLGILAIIFKPLYFFVYIQLNIFKYIVEISSRIDQVSIQSNTEIFVYILIFFLILFCVYRYPIKNENYYLKKSKKILKYNN